MAEPAFETLRLTVSPGERESFQFDLPGPSCIVGRSSKACLSLSDALLSREHARIFLEGGKWFVEDLHSRNGTQLNGVRIAEPAPLSEGDRLSLGACTLTVGRSVSGAATQPTSSGMSWGQSVLRPASEILQASALHVEALAESEHAQLRNFAGRLQTLIEVNRALSTPVALDDLLQLILSKAFQQLKPEEGAVFVTRRDGSVFRAASRTVAPEGQALFNSKTLLEEVVAKGQAALVQDAQLDERFGASESMMSSGVHSLIAAPFVDQDGTALGMITLCSRAVARQFQEEDLELLTSLASVAALRIRNVALSEEAAERRRLADQMELARQIQQGLLPESLPELEGWALHAVNRPSDVVSGDFYTTVLRGEPPELVMLIADVAGKGVAASLLTASLEALCAGPLEAGLPPDEVFTRVSSRLLRRTPPEKYATALLAVLDPASGRLRFANAGHLPALVVDRSGGHRFLFARGIPLGLLPTAEYEQGEVLLSPGDMLVLFTDGLTEACDRAEVEFGQERLVEACVELRVLPLAEIATRLEEKLNAFTAGAPPSDDRTLMLLRRLT